MPTNESNQKKNQECCVRQASQIKAINYFQLRYGCLIQMNTIRNDIFRKWENNGRINRNGICHAANESMLKQTAPVLTRFACKSVGLTETEPEHSPWAFFRNIRIQLNVFLNWMLYLLRPESHSTSSLCWSIIWLFFYHTRYTCLHQENSKKNYPTSNYLLLARYSFLGTMHNLNGLRTLLLVVFIFFNYIFVASAKQKTHTKWRYIMHWNQLNRFGLHNFFSPLRIFSLHSHRKFHGFYL